MEIENSTKKYYETSITRHYSHHMVQVFAKPKFVWIEERIPFRGKNVLDVGSGNGYFAQYFIKDCDLTALDISENQLKGNPASRKIIGSAYDLPFEDNAFDMVFCSNLLHHLENPLAAVKEMARVSRKKVIISEPNRDNPIIFIICAILKRERGGILYSKRFLTKLLRQANLKMKEHTYIGGLVMPNATPEFTLPIALPHSMGRLSVSQIIIAEKRERMRNSCVPDTNGFAG